LNDGQEVIHEIQKPKATGNIQILFNLAEEGCVAKISNEGEYFEGDAIVYENDESPFAVVK
jgi:dihydroxy-acid dehydratase